MDQQVTSYSTNDGNWAANAVFDICKTALKTGLLEVVLKTIRRRHHLACPWADTGGVNHWSNWERQTSTIKFMRVIALLLNKHGLFKLSFTVIKVTCFTLTFRFKCIYDCIWFHHLNLLIFGINGWTCTQLKTVSQRKRNLMREESISNQDWNPSETKKFNEWTFCGTIGNFYF